LGESARAHNSRKSQTTSVVSAVILQGGLFFTRNSPVKSN
jgi:hypothetical protein